MAITARLLVFVILLLAGLAGWHYVRSPSSGGPRAAVAESDAVDTEHKAPMRGRYVQVDAPNLSIEFQMGHLISFDGTRETGERVYLQAGPRLQVRGMGRDDVMWVLKDGRLRLDREGLPSLFYRRASR